MQFIVNFYQRNETVLIEADSEDQAYALFEQVYKTEKVKLLFISLNFKSELNNAVLSFVKSRKIKSEVFLLDEKDPQEYINRIDSSWSGAIPSTLFLKKGIRVFVEKDLNYDDLLKQYNALK